ncbi:MAG: DNA repair protein RadC [Thermodesulfobacteriota bacterium]
MRRIKDIPDFDRPREKLAEKGPEALSDAELLAVLLGSGVRGRNVFQVARSILKIIDTNKKKLDVASLVSIEGVGFAKACQVLASLEFARRRLPRKEIVIRTTRDVLPLISYIADRKQEHFICVSLNGANEVIGNRVVTVGLLNKNQVHPREVFVDAITDRAASVILAHNHPSGILDPSPDDILATRQLVDAGKIIGISVLDHVIITRKGFLSLREKGYFK